MGAYASLGLLADAAASLQSFVTVFVSIYILLHLRVRAAVLDSAAVFHRGRNSATIPGRSRAARTSASSVAGYPTLGPLDLSPIVAVIVLLVAAELVNALIGALL